MGALLRRQNICDFHDTTILPVDLLNPKPLPQSNPPVGVSIMIVKISTTLSLPKEYI